MAMSAVSSSSERSAAGGALSALGGAAAVGLLFSSFRGVDPGRIWSLVAAIGGPSVLLLVPSLLSVALESLGFQRAVRVLGSTAPVTGLFRVRVATDSLGNLLPMGALLVEAMKPRLLERHAAVPVAVGIAGVAARKYLLVLSQAAYLAVGFFVGRGALRAGLERLGAPSVLVFLPLVAALVLAIAATAMASALGAGTALQHLLPILARVPSEKLRDGLARCQHALRRTDDTLARFFRSAWSVRVKILVLYLGAWLLEATETWAMLHSLGTGVGWGDAVGIEALVMLARSVLVVLPGGLGAQELGYATLLGSVGAEPGVVAAFALLKRVRELLWMLAGFALLGGERRRHARAPVVPNRAVYDAKSPLSATL